MRIFCCFAGRLGRFARARLAPVSAPPTEPALWCRPATVLALRDPRRAGACMAGWR